MKLRGILVATAALGLMAGAGAGCAESAEGGQIKCSGANSCAGKGACHAVDGSHDCAGNNSCKGKGWVYKRSPAECSAMGGKVIQDG